MNRKIGILTFQRTINYGGTLQCYALYSFLRLQYPDDRIEIIDIHNEFVEDNLNVIRAPTSLKKTLSTIKDLFRIKAKSEKISEFKNFVENKFILSQRCIGEAEFLKVANGYDVIVVGSDQVWNPNVHSRLGNFDKRYFLEKVVKSCKKIAYAASFGSYSLNDLPNDIVENIVNFNCLSLRETSAQEILQDKIKRDVFNVCDPTLLLDSKSWRDLSTGSKNSLESLLIYSLNYSKPFKDSVRDLKDITGLRTVQISNDPFTPKEVDVKPSRLGPKQFLDLFVNAKVVVTDSFHGVVFSIIFKKPFLVLSHGYNISRIESLLRVVQSSDRIIRNRSEASSKAHMLLSIDDINYSELEGFIAQSKDYISDSIGKL